MADYGVTSAGFTIKPYSVILAELSTKAKSSDFFGPTVNLSLYTPLGILIRFYSFVLFTVWQLVQALYFTLWVSTAEGAHLDRLVALRGMSRKPATAAEVTLTLAGDANASILLGSIVGTKSEIQYRLAETVVLDGGGAGTGRFICTITGPSGNQPAASITEIITPIDGWTSATNASDAAGGTDEETDAELKIRFDQLTNVSKLESDLMAVAGVEQVSIIENNTVSEVDGQPGCSFECVVLGGDQADIIDVIFKDKPFGIQAYGANTETRYDRNGTPYTIGMSRPTQKDIYVKFEITTGTGWDLTTGTAALKTAAVAYIGGTDTQNGSTIYPGLKMGDDVIDWRVQACSLGIPGILTVVAKIKIGSGPTLTDNLTIAAREIARTIDTHVSVVVSS